MKLKLFSAIIFSVLLMGCSDKGNADLILFNGNVITLNDNSPRAEAIAVRNDTIVAVGSNMEIENYKTDKTEVIDLHGATVIPGFVESHAHFLGTGKALLNLDLSKAENWDEIIATVSDAADNALPGEWIVGRGWHQEKWVEPPYKNFNGYPYNDQLSRATPFNPVMLVHASGHALIANKKAMELAEVNENTPSPRGGDIVRDSSGVLVGVFRENAMELIEKVYDKAFERLSPEKKYAILKKQAEAVMQNALKYGITMFYDAGSDFETIDFFKTLADSGNLKLRLNVMIYDDYDKMKKNLNEYKLIDYGNGFLTVRAIKQFADGALGSRGAWMLEDYSDLPGWRGMSVTPPRKIAQVAELAINNGFQLCTHAIGDRANREVLNVYEKTFKNHPEIDSHSLRWRIEHAQHVSPKDKPRFAEMGIIAAMQGIHATSDAPFVEERLGEKRAREESYCWRDLLNYGTLIVNGTDSPVEKLDPIACYYASVTRKTKTGEAFYPEQKMTREEALKSYTINGAYAAFKENQVGSIVAGKLADLTVLSQDITEVPENEIKKTKVLFTIVDGKIVYRNNR
jgi:predicted amidohydrolase YtcJ